MSTMEIKNPALVNYPDLQQLPITSGWEFYKKKASSIGHLTSGIPEFLSFHNQYLGGHGFALGHLYELSSFVDVGKKNILYQTVQMALKKGVSVLWLDTSLGLSAKMLASGLSSVELNSIRVWRCPTLPQFFRIIQKIIKLFDLQQDPSLFSNTTPLDPYWKSLKLIILDSVHSYFAPIVGDGLSQWTYLASEVGRHLRYLSHTYSLCVIMTNNASRWQNVVRPSLGPFWKFVPDQQLLLENLSIMSEHHEQGHENLKKLTCTKSITGIHGSVTFHLPSLPSNSL